MCQKATAFLAILTTFFSRLCFGGVLRRSSSAMPAVLATAMPSTVTRTIDHGETSVKQCLQRASLSSKYWWGSTHTSHRGPLWSSWQ